MGFFLGNLVSKFLMTPDNFGPFVNKTRDKRFCLNFTSIKIHRELTYVMPATGYILTLANIFIALKFSTNRHHVKNKTVCSEILFSKDL